MGKRFDALRVALALPKRTNWKAAYDTVDVANRKQLELINLLRKQKQDQVVRADTAEFTVERLQDAGNRVADQLKLAKQEQRTEERSHAEKMRNPFNFKEAIEAGNPHAFQTGHRGNAWKCKVCGKGTRALDHKGLPSVPAKRSQAGDRVYISNEVDKETYCSPSERSTDGYYVSGRSLNYSSDNPNRRRAFVHVFTCDKIRSRRNDSTVIVKGDSDFIMSKKTIGKWLWGADMKAVRTMAKAHHKYTKLCSCITYEGDLADNSNGQIGSLITAESES